MGAIINCDSKEIYIGAILKLEENHQAQLMHLIEEFLNNDDFQAEMHFVSESEKEYQEEKTFLLNKLCELENENNDLFTKLKVLNDEKENMLLKIEELNENIEHQKDFISQMQLHNESIIQRVYLKKTKKIYLNIHKE